MPEASQILQNALVAIDNLPDLSNDVLDLNRRLVNAVLKKLKGAAGKPATSLLDNLEASRAKIEAYTGKPTNEAVATPVNWQNADFRVLDIRLGATKQSPLTKFRKGLGERSLAFQFHEWETQKFGRSRLDDLRDNPSRQDRTEGHIPEFITFHELPNSACVVKGIQHGTKLLVLELLSGMPGTSALLFFCFSQFRAVNYTDLPGLSDTFRATEWITELCKRIDQWFHQCLLAYSDCTNKKRRSRMIEPELSLCRSKRARIATVHETHPEEATSDDCEPSNIEGQTTREVAIDDSPTVQEESSNPAIRSHFDQPAPSQPVAGMPAWVSEASAMTTSSNRGEFSDLLSPFDVGFDYSSFLSDSALFMPDPAPQTFQTV